MQIPCQFQEAAQGAAVSVQSPRALLIERIIRASHCKLFRCVERYQLKGSDGKFYSAGFPFGVHYVGEKSAPYFVSESIREGTTHGKRFNSREEWEANQKHYQDLQDATFREALNAMDDERLQSQRAYWFVMGLLAALVLGLAIYAMPLDVLALALFFILSGVTVAGGMIWSQRGESGKEEGR